MKINVVVISFKFNFFAEKIVKEYNSNSDLFLVHVDKTDAQIESFENKEKIKKIFIYRPDEDQSEPNLHWKVLEKIFDNNYPNILDCDYILFLDHDVLYSDMDNVILKTKKIIENNENKDIWALYSADHIKKWDWGFATIPFFMIKSNSPYRGNHLGSWQPYVSKHGEFVDTGRHIARKIRNNVLSIHYKKDLREVDYHFGSLWYFFELHASSYKRGNKHSIEVTSVSDSIFIRNFYYEKICRLFSDVCFPDLERMKHSNIFSKFLNKKLKNMIPEYEEMINVFSTKEKMIQFAIDNLNFNKVFIKKDYFDDILIFCEEKCVSVEKPKFIYDIVLWDNASAEEIVDMFSKNISDNGLLIQEYSDDIDICCLFMKKINISIVYFEGKKYAFFSKNMYLVKELKCNELVPDDISLLFEKISIKKNKEYFDLIEKISQKTVYYSLFSENFNKKDNLIFCSEYMDFLKTNSGCCSSISLIGDNVDKKDKLLKTVYKSFYYKDYIEKTLDIFLNKNDFVVTEFLNKKFIVITSNEFFDADNIFFDSEAEYEVSRDNLIGAPIFFSGKKICDYLEESDFYYKSIFPSNVSVFFSKSKFCYNDVERIEKTNNKSINGITLFVDGIEMNVRSREKIHHLQCWDLIKEKIKKEKTVWDTPCCFNEFHFLLDKENILSKNMKLIDFNLEKIKEEVKEDSFIYHYCVPVENHEKEKIIKDFFDICARNNINNLYYIQLPFIVSIENTFDIYHHSLMRYSHEIKEISFFGNDKKDYVVFFERKK